MRAPLPSPDSGCRSGLRSTSARTNEWSAHSKSWSKRFARRSCTKSGTTSGWRKRPCRTRRSAKGPERPVPQDERVAGALHRRLDLADAYVVVTGRVDLHQAAFQPGRAAVDQRDPVCPQAMRDLPPNRVDGGCPTGEPLSDELLRARQDAHVEGLPLDHV